MGPFGETEPIQPTIQVLTGIASAEKPIPEGHPPRVNEDRITFDGASLILADGLGGHGNGAQAAEIGVNTTLAYMKQHISPTDTADQVTGVLRGALLQAHRQVSDFSLFPTETFNDQQVLKPGTTLLVGRLVFGEGPTGCRLVLAWAGDSRAYIEYPNGQIKQLTKDDNLQQTFGTTGKPFVLEPPNRMHGLRVAQYDWHHLFSPRFTIDKTRADEIDRILDGVEDPQSLSQYTNDPTYNMLLIAFFNMRHQVTQSIGGNTKNLEPHVEIFDIPVGSRIWYTTDGIHDVLPETDLFQVFREAGSLDVSPDARAQHVVKATDAWKNGQLNGRHKDDDKTVGFQEIRRA